MIGSLVFFALIGVFVFTAMQAAKESSVSPSSRPGNVVQADDGSGEHMNPTACICTCRDWQRHRAHFATRAPMRLCRHLTGWYARHNNTLPEHLQAHATMIALLASEGQGMPCDAGTEYGHLDELPYVLYVAMSHDKVVRARLILGGRRYDLRLDTGEWVPEPPPRNRHYLHRAVQLANTAFKKK